MFAVIKTDRDPLVIQTSDDGTTISWYFNSPDVRIFNQFKAEYKHGF